MCEIGGVAIGVCLLILSCFDWKKRRLPICLIWLTGSITLIFRIWFIQDSIWSTVGGIGIGILLLCISKWTKEAIGYGDSLLILILGIYLGAVALLSQVFWAMLLSSLAFLAASIRKGWRRRRELPFVPFLCLAYWLEVFL